jgi:hypothetical protein
MTYFGHGRHRCKNVFVYLDDFPELNASPPELSLADEEEEEEGAFMAEWYEEWLASEYDDVRRRYYDAEFDEELFKQTLASSNEEANRLFLRAIALEREADFFDSFAGLGSSEAATSRARARALRERIPHARLEAICASMRRHLLSPAARVRVDICKAPGASVSEQGGLF